MNFTTKNLQRVMYDLLGIGPAGGAIYSCNQALCYVPNKPIDTGHLTAILTYEYSKWCQGKVIVKYG